MARHNEFGAEAERLAADYLEQRGWTIIERNWRWRRKEVDLIARRDRLVAFVEVRARWSTGHGHPLETIGWRKRRDLEQAAQAWIGRYGRAGEAYRFDAVAVTPAAGAEDDAARGLIVDHREDAWFV